jgi:hypothetical protein
MTLSTLAASRYVVQWISRYQHQVRQLAGLEGTQVMLHAEGPGGQQGRGLNRLPGLQPELHLSPQVQMQRGG